jgi:hypothetical protein
VLGLIAAAGIVILVAMVIRHQVQARKLEAISRSHGELQYEFARLVRLSERESEDKTRAP